jgi:hypothetical protein
MLRAIDNNLQSRSRCRGDLHAAHELCDRLDNRRASRICIGRDHASIDTAPVQGDDLWKWLIDRLLRLRAVFGPLLEEAVPAGAMQSAQP